MKLGTLQKNCRRDSVQCLVAGDAINFTPTNSRNWKTTHDQSDVNNVSREFGP